MGQNIVFNFYGGIRLVNLFSVFLTFRKWCLKGVSVLRTWSLGQGVVKTGGGFILSAGIVLRSCGYVRGFRRGSVCLPVIILRRLSGFGGKDSRVGCGTHRFMHRLSALADGSLFLGKTSLKPNGNALRIIAKSGCRRGVCRSFPRGATSRHVLSYALSITRSRGSQGIGAVLIAGSIGLHVGTHSLNVRIRSCVASGIVGISVFGHTRSVCRGVSPSLVSGVCTSPSNVSTSLFSVGSGLRPGRYFVLGDIHGSILTHCGPFAGGFGGIRGTDGCNVRPHGTRRDFTFRILGSPSMGLVKLAKGTKANGALLTLTSTLGRTGICGRVLLTHPVITLTGGSLKFLPNSRGRGITPCVRPLFSGLGIVGKRFTPNKSSTHGVSSLRGGKRLIVRTLTFVHNQDLSRAFYVVSRTRGLAPRRVGAVVAHTKRKAGVMFAKSVRRVSSPCLSTRDGNLTCVISGVGKRRLFTRVGLVGKRHDRLSRLTSSLL